MDDFYETQEGQKILAMKLIGDDVHIKTEDGNLVIENYWMGRIVHGMSIVSLQEIAFDDDKFGNFEGA